MRFFFFNDTATPEIYTLSLHDALPIFRTAVASTAAALEIVDSRIAGWDIRITDTVADNASSAMFVLGDTRVPLDRKSTRLNSSHANISYAVFCLKKKKKYLVSVSFYYS